MNKEVKIDTRKKVCGFLTKPRVVYFSFVIISIIFLVIGIICFNTNSLGQEIFISIGCSTLAAAIMGFVLEKVNQNKEYNNLLERKKILTNRISEKAVSAFFFLGDQWKNDYFDNNKSVKDLIEEIKKETKSLVKLNERALFYLRFLYEDLLRCYEGLFVGEEWKGINSARMYLGLIIQRDKDTIESFYIFSIYQCLRKIPSISESFNTSVNEFDYVKRIKEEIKSIGKNHFNTSVICPAFVDINLVRGIPQMKKFDDTYKGRKIIIDEKVK